MCPPYASGRTPSFQSCHRRRRVLTLESDPVRSRPLPVGDPQRLHLSKETRPHSDTASLGDRSCSCLSFFLSHPGTYLRRSQADRSTCKRSETSGQCHPLCRVPFIRSVRSKWLTFACPTPRVRDFQSWSAVVEESLASPRHCSAPRHPSQSMPRQTPSRLISFLCPSTLTHVGRSGYGVSHEAGASPWMHLDGDLLSLHCLTRSVMEPNATAAYPSRPIRRVRVWWYA